MTSMKSIFCSWISRRSPSSSWARSASRSKSVIPRCLSRVTRRFRPMTLEQTRENSCTCFPRPRYRSWFRIAALLLFCRAIELLFKLIMSFFTSSLGVICRALFAAASISSWIAGFASNLLPSSSRCSYSRSHWSSWFSCVVGTSTGLTGPVFPLSPALVSVRCTML